MAIQREYHAVNIENEVPFSKTPRCILLSMLQIMKILWSLLWDWLKVTLAIQLSQIQSKCGIKGFNYIFEWIPLYLNLFYSGTKEVHISKRYLYIYENKNICDVYACPLSLEEITTNSENLTCLNRFLFCAFLHYMTVLPLNTLLEARCMTPVQGARPSQQPCPLVIPEGHPGRSFCHPV